MKLKFHPGPFEAVVCFLSQMDVSNGILSHGVHFNKGHFQDCAVFVWQVCENKEVIIVQMVATEEEGGVTNTGLHPGQKVPRTFEGWDDSRPAFLTTVFRDRKTEEYVFEFETVSSTWTFDCLQELLQGAPFKRSRSYLERELGLGLTGTRLGFTGRIHMLWSNNLSCGQRQALFKNGNVWIGYPTNHHISAVTKSVKKVTIHRIEN